MRLHIEESQKAATLWLTNEEQRSEAAMTAVSALTKEWHTKGYMPVVFYSGRDDLYDCTAALLLHNRSEAAEREVKRRKALAQRERRDGPEPAR